MEGRRMPTGVERNSDFRTFRGWRGPMLIALLQVAPVAVQPSDDGFLGIGIGFSNSSYRQMRCINDVEYERRVKQTTISGLAEFIFPSGKAGISAFAGAISSTTVEIPEADFKDPRDGVFMAIRGGPEFDKSSVQVGLLLLPDHEGELRLLPNARLRVGEGSGIHMRIDVLNVSQPGQMPLTSLGLGFGTPGRNSVSGFLGYGLAPLANVRDANSNTTGGVFAEGSLAITRRIDLSLSAFAGNAQLLGAGLRVHAIR